MANRLASETSPYLLQHKDNPVDWYAWGEDAFAEARRLDKPVLLSIGYSACHWCHVMAHESFEDEATAADMNALFVNIKVDREERPDVDAIYMQAVQTLTSRGGWPMTVFLMPDGRPFYAGTYFPPAERGGMPAFRRVLAAVENAYREKRQDIERIGSQLQAQIGAMADMRPGDDALAPTLLDDVVEAIEREYDPEHAGFGRAPKFPQPMTLDFLMRYYKRSRSDRALRIVEHTLEAMANGGMYDQAGGGFHRYSTDDVWLVPHFEKMLYDNALLAIAYLDAYRLTGKRFYRRVTEETLDYVLREMTDAGGGFYSSQDADSEGEEGLFFLWTPAELIDVVGEADATLIGEFYGVSEGGNFEGRNILHVARPPETFAAAHGISEDELEARIAAAKLRLYEARERRVHPGRDDKVLTAWNGLMQRAFAAAALALDSQPYRDAAVRNADFLLASLRPSGRLLRTWKNGVAKLNGYLEDYGCLVDALLATYAASFEPRFLRAATELTEEMLRLFWDDAAQGFYDTGADHETLITRPRDLFDNATPAGNSVATGVLLKLAVLTDSAAYEAKALASLRTVANVFERAPTAFGWLLCALDFHLSPSQELAVVWPDGAASAKPLLDAVRTAYLPNLLLVGAREGEGADLTPLLQERPAGAAATAYVCERYVCQAPTADPAELRRQLGVA